MKDVDIALELLEKENYTLVVVKDKEVVFTSYDKGIKPLYILSTTLKDKLQGSSIADRVTGRAAAMLSAYVGAKELKTKLISQNAINILNQTNIIYDYDAFVPYIENRDRTGMCPIETLSLNVNNISDLLVEIEKFFESIKNK